MAGCTTFVYLSMTTAVARNMTNYIIYYNTYFVMARNTNFCKNKIILLILYHYFNIILL